MTGGSYEGSFFLCNRRLTDLTACYLDCNCWLCYYISCKYRFYCTENYIQAGIIKCAERAE